MNEQIFPGPPQMVKIDGSKVRSLREAKGLTQLYIATVVGVTTDTISRWENKRYPSIKQENGLKLAEALEVSLGEILDTEKPPTEPQEQEVAEVIVQQIRPRRQFRPLIWLLLLTAILILPFIWFHFKQPEIPVVSISASRILPPHIPSGQPFPVIIQVKAVQESSFSLILREELPPGCELIQSAPPHTGIDKKTGSIKWLSRIQGPLTTFVYLAKQEPATNSGSSLRFSGSVTLRNEGGSGTSISGSQVVPIANYHWADTNQDNRIVDDEILEAYDVFSALDELNYDWQEIDDIWSGEGYHWDKASQKYVILP
ncbi:MAG: helix-turn-helix transcriptional regulator [Proteobacteria bacterium]|nr:helix-turn-helix transcriptional regulator [Pseudomonadota bacterium]